MLDRKTGRYFQLNTVAAEMLRMLGDGKPKSEVVAAVVGTYDVERQRAQHDLDALAAEALGAGILLERGA